MPIDMTSRRFLPVKLCIYCGKSDPKTKLIDEHLIPHALSGTLILPKSSCARCQKEINRFETRVIRETYGPFRWREGIRSRKEKPRLVPAHVTLGGRRIRVMVPEKETVATFPIVNLQRPGILQIPEYNDSVWRGASLSGRRDEPQVKSYWRLSGDFINEGLTLRWTDFGRFVCKAAHGFAVAIAGVNGFSHWLPPYILGENKNIPYLVGRYDGSMYVDELPTRSIFNWEIRLIGGRKLLSIHVILFPEMGQPPIEVISGDLSEDQFFELRQKNANGDLDFNVLLK